MPDDRGGLSTGEVLFGAIIVYLLWRQGSLGKIFSSFTAGGSGGAGGVGYGGGSSTGSGAGTSGGGAGQGGCGCKGGGGTNVLLEPPIVGVPHGPYAGF